ncbi:MAG: hypothetical protein HND53_10235 [Proteobacteria bacterium]|nr:hypothetical protein [Pseudomonadota bacterium]NOG60868.1 hypothetical protein [Pseudomonadota bacterium]
MIERFEREMGISNKEFYRLLPQALKNMDYEIINDNLINANYAGGKIEIEHGVEQKRKIASLELPVLHVTFTFADISPDNIELFNTKFSQVYQRGGG